MKREPYMVSVKEFANMSGLSQKMVRSICKKEGFPVFRFGAKFYIHSIEAEKWLVEYAKASKIDTLSRKDKE